jgi:hypothetical protein
LVHVLSAWGWLFVLFALTLIIASRSGRSTNHTSLRRGHEQMLMTYALVLAPAFSLLGSWVLVSVQSSVRQGLPFLLLVLPLLGASVPLALRHARSRAAAVDGRQLSIVVVAAGAATAILGIGVALAAVGVWRDDFGRQLANEQARAASAIVSSGSQSIPVSIWWQAPEIQVLTNLPTETAHGAAPATVRVFTSVQALQERGRPDARVYESDCGDVLYASSAAVVCRAP